MADSASHPWILGKLSPEAERARFVIMHASGADPLILVEALTTSAKETERLLHLIVREAREHGHSWGEIGTALGTTRQAAMRRFGQPHDVEP